MIDTRWAIAFGFLFAIAWFACWAATVVPGPAETVRWIVGNALALLVGVAIGVALTRRRARESS